MQCKIKEKIKKKSLSLERYGINSLAWNKEDAKNIIRSIEKDKIGILGGDVYKLTFNLEALSDNWVCESKELESEEEFYARSKHETFQYLSDYPVETGENILFAIIFTERIT